MLTIFMSETIHFLLQYMIGLVFLVKLQIEELAQVCPMVYRGRFAILVYQGSLYGG